LCYQQPTDINSFLLEQLKQRKTNGFKTGIFSEEHINNIFNLFDLTKSNKIKQQQCREALKILASSQLEQEQIENTEIPSEVDNKQFKEICYKVLGGQ
jgi:Glu-tRNA(Gln) amidotransferase subunit E-like FAD-binding protein